MPPIPIRILVAEDDPMMRLGLQQILDAQSNIEVIDVVENGFQAVEKAAALNPDMIVMDLGMPHMDGIAATQEIKANHSEVRVLMLTSHTCETEVIAALSSGADAYCVKGTGIETLLRAIATVMDGGVYLDAQVARQVITDLSTRQTSPATHPIVGKLTDREMEILELIVDGLSNNEIGEHLYLSPNTVKSYVRGIMNKLVVSDRVQAAVVALRSGLVR